jgi:hypothetical protein
MHVDISETALMIIFGVPMLWYCIRNNLLKELNIRGLIAKFKDRDRPPPR